MSAPEFVAGYVVAGKYAIRSVLLNGGATISYRATGPKNRDVALKVYDPQILSFPDVLKTLAQYKSMGSRLPAQQIMPIAESGTDSNSGAPFTITDFEARPTLARLIDRGPLSATDMLVLLRNLARAVDLLHQSGSASLSLHPFNVFVGPGPQYEVRIADFGASLVRTVLPVADKAGRWMPWLAPEQIKAQGTPSQPADIFAIALIAFFAVTGKPYWRSSQAKTPDTTALRREILGERMPASVRAGEFSVALNPAVDAVFARALAFRPAERYSTVREFVAGLEMALTGRVAAEPEARPAAQNLASAVVKADEAEPAAQRAPSQGDAVPATQRMAAPPPRKMPQRSTMLGIGSAAAAVASGASATSPGPRPPMATMMGMGETVAEGPPAAAPKAPEPIAAPPAHIPVAATPATAKASPPAMAAAPAKASPPAMAAAPAKASPPAMAAAPAKASPPAMAAAPAKASPDAVPAAPAKASPPAMPTAAATTARAKSPPAMPATTAMWAAPAMPVAPATPAEPPIATPSTTTARQGGPPPLPFAPPPAQLEEILARFEAAPPDPLPAAPSVTSTAAAQTPPTWRTTDQRDSATERVETGVAVIGSVVGSDPAEAPKKSRLRWVASAAAILILAGGAAWALSGGSSSSSASRTASDSNATARARLTAAEAAPISVEVPSATAQPPPANTVEPENSAAAVEPAAPAPSPPQVQEPPATEPIEPTAAHGAPAPQSAPAAPESAPALHAQPSKKPCGKFLKRCK